MADEGRVVLRVELDEGAASKAVSRSPGAQAAASSVRQQLEAAGASEAEIAAALGLPAPAKARKPSAAKSRREIDVERDINLRQKASQIEQERRAEERAARIAARQADRPSAIASLASSTARAGAASQAAALARPFGPGAAAGAATAASVAVAAGGPAAPAIAAGLGAAAAVAIPQIIAFGVALKTATDSLREIEQLGTVNAEIARAQALRDVRGVLGRIRRGRQLEDEAPDFIRARSQLQQELLDLGAAINERVLPVLTNLLDTATTLVDTIGPIALLFVDTNLEAIQRVFQLVIGALELLPGFGGLIEFIRESWDELREWLEQQKQERLNAEGEAWQKILAPGGVFDIDAFIEGLTPEQMAT